MFACRRLTLAQGLLQQPLQAAMSMDDCRSFESDLACTYARTGDIKSEQIPPTNMTMYMSSGHGKSGPDLDLSHMALPDLDAEDDFSDLLFNMESEESALPSFNQFF